VEVEGEKQTHTFKVSQVVEHELSSDAYQFTNPLYQLIFNEIVTANATDNFLDIKYFINHQHDEIRKFAIDVFETPYRLHNWEKQQIFVNTEESMLKSTVNGAIYSLRLKLIERMKKELSEELKQELIKLSSDTDVVMIFIDLLCRFIINNFF
jgi:hypothetical protein